MDFLVLFLPCYILFLPQIFVHFCCIRVTFFFTEIFVHFCSMCVWSVLLLMVAWISLLMGDRTLIIRKRKHKIMKEKYFNQERERKHKLMGDSTLLHFLCSNITLQYMKYIKKLRQSTQKQLMGQKWILAIHQVWSMVVIGFPGFIQLK